MLSNHDQRHVDPDVHACHTEDDHCCDASSDQELPADRDGGGGTDGGCGAPMTRRAGGGVDGGRGRSARGIRLGYTKSPVIAEMDGDNSGQQDGFGSAAAAAAAAGGDCNGGASTGPGAADPVLS